MFIIITLLVGLVVGVIAKLVVPGPDPGGTIVTILLGIAGAALAGFTGQALGWYVAGEGPGLIASVLGAAVLLLIYRAIVRRRVP